uniref:UMP/CMP kinase n=1 Tax=Noctiluca scintillans TaxID=2966 RepID=A0A7S1AEG2_NOCSC
MVDFESRVLFVLGGPGAGKGTQCAKICDNFPNWAHISAGDCLRAERNDPSSKDGELINSLIVDGKIVPVAITVKLLMKAMEQKRQEGKTSFLIDGFPRNQDNVSGWNDNVKGVKLLGVLYFTANEQELEKRLLSRGESSGRADDNLESIRKRFMTFEGESLPIVAAYERDDLVFTVDGMPPVEEVWANTEKIIQKFQELE